MARIAFIGLGVMGAPMARHLAKAGHTVTVYNRTYSKAAAWVATNGGRAAPVIAAYSRICRLIGPTGSGQLAKMMNQICIAGVVQGLSEALAFGEKAGLDGRAVVEVISQGAAGSWQMVNRHDTMLDDRFNFGFAVDWMRKDLGICLATGDEIGAPLPLTALVDQFYKDVQAMGGGRWDTSSLLRRLKAFDREDPDQR